MNPTTAPSKAIRDLLEDLEHGRPLAPLTTIAYHNAIASWWSLFAEARGLPSDITELASPVAKDDLADLIAMARTGELRRNNRAGRRAAELEGRPLAPNTLDGLMSALRNAHLRAGLHWAGDDADIRGLIAGYKRAVEHRPTRARTVATREMRALFEVAPQGPVQAAGLARVRAAASQLGISITRAAAITPADITWDQDRIIVDCAGTKRQATCLGTQLQDPLVGATCAHCLLGAWAASAPPGAPLLEPGRTAAAQRSARRLHNTVAAGRVGFRNGIIELDDHADRLWSLVAIAATPALAAWLRARAMMLPMLAVGLRCDDLDTAPRRLQRLATDKATLTVFPKGLEGAPRDITLVATGGPLCPVSALWTYDKWASVFLPHRRHMFVPSRGQMTPRAAEVHRPDGSRATYQFLRIWLLEHCQRVEETEPGVRQLVTPHSARRTFAQNAAAAGYDVAEIQQSMGHTKVTTTENYLERHTDPLEVAADVMSGIAGDRHAC